MPKYFWLKLDRNFFKRHDIRIIEDMPNGKDYILFYLKLLVESIDHEGALRFSDTIPYDERMLASVSNTNVDIVRSAIKIFTELGLMEMLDDKTIYLKETQKMLGENSTERVQRFREKQKLLTLVKDDMKRFSNVTETENVTEIEKELEIDKELDKDLKDYNDSPPKKMSRFIKPTLDEVAKYCQERKNNINPQDFIDSNEAKGWLVGTTKTPMKDWKAVIRTWEAFRKKDTVNNKQGKIVTDTSKYDR